MNIQNAKQVTEVWQLPGNIIDAINQAKEAGLNTIKAVYEKSYIDLAVSGGTRYYQDGIDYAHSLGMDFVFILNLKRYTNSQTFNTFHLPEEETAVLNFNDHFTWILQNYPGLDGIELEEPYNHNALGDGVAERDFYNAWFTTLREIINNINPGVLLGYNTATHVLSSQLKQGIDKDFISTNYLFDYVVPQVSYPEINRLQEIYNNYRSWYGFTVIPQIMLTYNSIYNNSICPDKTQPSCWNQGFFNQLSWLVLQNIPFTILNRERMNRLADLWPYDTTPGSNALEKISFINAGQIEDPPVEDPPVEDPPVEDPPVEDPPVEGNNFDMAIIIILGTIAGVEILGPRK